MLLSFLSYPLSVDNIKRLNFRSVSVATEEKVDLKTKRSQTTNFQLLSYCQKCQFEVLF